MEYIKGLRFKNHESHKDTIAELYHLNKYYLTEQAKDALIDAQECMSKHIPEKPINTSYAKPDSHNPDIPIYMFRAECPCCQNILVETEVSEILPYAPTKNYFFEKDVEDTEAWRINYCIICGKAIDWRTEEE